MKLWIEAKAINSTRVLCWGNKNNVNYEYVYYQKSSCKKITVKISSYGKLSANSAFHPCWVGKWIPASAGKAKTGRPMVHSVSGWMRGVQVKLRSLENACHTWATYRCDHDKVLYKSTFTLPYLIMAPSCPHFLGVINAGKLAPSYCAPQPPVSEPRMRSSPVLRKPNVPTR